jgi:hypothetical protein
MKCDDFSTQAVMISAHTGIQEVFLDALEPNQSYTEAVRVPGPPIARLPDEMPLPRQD